MEHPLRSRLTQDSSATGASTFSPSEESTSSGTVWRPDHAEGSRTPSTLSAGWPHQLRDVCLRRGARRVRTRRIRSRGRHKHRARRAVGHAPGADRVVLVLRHQRVRLGSEAKVHQRPARDRAGQPPRPRTHVPHRPDPAASPEASRRPSGEKRIAVTWARWPAGRRRGCTVPRIEANEGGGDGVHPIPDLAGGGHQHRAVGREQSRGHLDRLELPADAPGGELDQPERATGAGVVASPLRR
jgi:hypothetical protein